MKVLERSPASFSRKYLMMPVAQKNVMALTWERCQMFSMKLSLGAAVLALCFAKMAFADTVEQSMKEFEKIKKASDAKTMTEIEEKLAISKETRKELRQEIDKSLSYVGSTYFNNATPYGDTNNSTALLTFKWLNPATGMSTAGPTPTTVDYYRYVGPSTAMNGVNVNTSVGWTLVGASTSVATYFALSASFSGPEQLYLSVPLDANGNIITINGVGGQNDAESFVFGFQTPLPATLPLFLTGIAMIGWVTSRSKERNRSHVG
jgi:hypothetical protein